MLVSLSISHAQPTVELQKLTGDFSYYSTAFGNDVSISGNFAVVGSALNYENSLSCGSVYVYFFNGTEWILYTRLIASDLEEDAYFGNSVYISGNYIIVGAVGSNDNGYRSGAAYIFHFDGTSWSENSKIFPTDPAESDRFGESVCISGNFAIVGASKDDDNAINSGSAYVFHYDGSSWTQQAKLNASNAAGDDRFGISTSISGDYAVVGAYFNDANGSNSGSAYIFHFNGATWIEQTQLFPSENNSNQYFGASVSISGDYAIVGSKGDGVFGNNAGAAYIYYYDGFFWTEQEKIYASDAYGYDFFGSSVNILGDYAIVGALGDDDNGSSSGSAYIFNRTGTSWTEEEKLIALDGDSNDHFGISVGISGDFAFIGAEDNEIEYGSAYIFGPPIPIFLTHPEDQTGICVGDNISFYITGEYFETIQWQVDKGLGFQDIINGDVYNNAETEILNITGVTLDMDNYQFRCQVSNAYNTGFSDTALLLLDTDDLEFFCDKDTLIELDEGQTSYTVSGTEFDPTITDDNCGNATLENNFNYTATLAGAQIPTGTTNIEWILSDNYGNSETCSHNITVNEYNPNQWFQVGGILEGDFSDDKFGNAVSLNSDGSILAVGAWQNDANGTNAGQTKIFQKVEDEWIQIGDDILGEAYSYFGCSVSLSSDGSVVAIGSNPIGPSGSARVYKNISGVWTKIGNDLEAGDEGGEFGYSVSLNSDGTIVAVGDPQYKPSGSNLGGVIIYEYNNGSWSQIGNPIVGEGYNDYFGISVSLNSDGSIIAVGAYQNDSGGYQAGQVRVFQNINDNWTQIGDGIVGEHDNDAAGISVSLNSEGSIVAIGAVANGDNGFYSGHVRVFESNNGSWTQIGDDIDGEDSGDESGRSVSLNSDGSVLAIGSPGNCNNGNRSGNVRVYKYISGTWTKIAENIEGAAEGDEFGCAVSLSSDGSIFAAGAHKNDSNGIDAGHVRIFNNPTVFTDISECSQNEFFIYPNPTFGMFTVSYANKKIKRITVFDITGKLILQKYKPQQYEIIDLSNVGSGIYIIKVYSEGKILTSQVIKN